VFRTTSRPGRPRGRPTGAVRGGPGVAVYPASVSDPSPGPARAKGYSEMEVLTWRNMGRRPGRQTGLGVALAGAQLAIGAAGDPHPPARNHAADQLNAPAPTHPPVRLYSIRSSTGPRRAPAAESRSAGAGGRLTQAGRRHRKPCCVINGRPLPRDAHHDDPAPTGPARGGLAARRRPSWRAWENPRGSPASRLYGATGS